MEDIMKSRIIKLSACLMASAMILTGGTVTSLAAQGEQAALGQTTFEVAAVTKTAAAKKTASTVTKKKTTSKYDKMGVAKVSSYVNVRSKASTDSKIVGKLKNKSVATILSKKNGWYKVKSGSVSGYVKAEYLVVGDADLVKSVSYKVATVKTETLRVRKKANSKASIVGLVSQDDKLKVVNAKNSDWVKVKTSDGKGYVSADYVKVSETYHYAEKITTQSVSASSSETAASTGSGGSAVANYGLQFLGRPYVWGGESLTNGSDCSGFIKSVYAHFGVSLPHSSYALRSVGRGVSYSEAQAGDIICYDGHVALYIGGGRIVHASNPTDGVKTSNAAYRQILAVRRVL